MRIFVSFRRSIPIRGPDKSVLKIRKTPHRRAKHAQERQIEEACGPLLSGSKSTPRFNVLHLVGHMFRGQA